MAQRRFFSHIWILILLEKSAIIKYGCFVSSVIIQLQKSHSLLRIWTMQSQQRHWRERSPINGAEVCCAKRMLIIKRAQSWRHGITEKRARKMKNIHSVIDVVAASRRMIQITFLFVLWRSNAFIYFSNPTSNDNDPASNVIIVHSFVEYHHEFIAH